MPAPSRRRPRRRRPAPPPDTIRLQGVRVHNLKGIDLRLPRGRLTVISGVSGSGKSSLAFDTLYAEGRRRYVECMSTYAQQFLERLPRPEVDRVHDIPPAIALQRAVPRSQARSTVGTSTEIHDYLRLLFARTGRSTCVACGRPVEAESPGKVADEALPRGGRVLVLFEADPPRPSRWREATARLLQAGFARLWRDGAVLRLEEAPPASGPLEVVADRLALDPAHRPRLTEAVDLAYRFGHDRCLLRFEDGSHRRFSRRLHCPDCDREYAVPQPRLFSPNSPLGACPACQGFGRSIQPDLSRIIPDRRRTLAEGPVDPWNKPAYRGAYHDLRRAGRRLGLRWDVPYHRLPAAQRRLVEEGDESFYGIRGFFQWLERRTYKVHVRVFLSRYRMYLPCPSCRGDKLRPEALAVRVSGRHIAELARLPARDLLCWLESLSLGPMEADIAAPILREVIRRLQVLDAVGLGYLDLERPSRTLSGGEAQRIHLASAVGSSLMDTLYVLDEPTIGLHPRDVERVLAVLRRLRDAGNTVVVVEHDPRVIRAADWLVDLGPGAGEAGGRVLYSGPPAGVLRRRGSATGRWLASPPAPAAPDPPPPSARRPRLELLGARANNLRSLDVRFPLRALTTVTGVSGSGKSSLVHDTLHVALREALGAGRSKASPYRALRGAKRIAGVELVDQSPIGRTPRSNPVTYIKAFDGIRRALAGTPAARQRRLTAGHFSFNVPGGRCTACDGAGAVLVEMHFLADMLLPCEACGGSRFGPRALEVRIRGRNVAEILALTVDHAAELFADRKEVADRLRLLQEIGLGYLRLGQPAPTLSGGEAQRLKLAAHLRAAPARGGGRRRAEPGTVFLLDEPTTGLHLQDVAILVRLLRRLVSEGNTLVVVEHHLDVLRASDWIVDLGPGAGEEGGRLVTQGTPEEVARSGGETGRFLAAGRQTAAGTGERAAPPSPGRRSAGGSRPRERRSRRRSPVSAERSS